MMTSTPVAGQLGTLGEVRGIWNESADEYGDYLGPDTMQLHNAKGSFVVAIQRTKHRAVTPSRGRCRPSTVDPSSPSDGTGAYARAKESGTIELTTNSARTTSSLSMTLTRIRAGLDGIGRRSHARWNNRGRLTIVFATCWSSSLETWSCRGPAPGPAASDGTPGRRRLRDDQAVKRKPDAARVDRPAPSDRLRRLLSTAGRINIAGSDGDAPHHRCQRPNPVRVAAQPEPLPADADGVPGRPYHRRANSDNRARRPRRCRRRLRTWRHRWATCP